MRSLKVFLPVVVHKNFMKVPQLSRPSLFRDVTNRHCGYGPLLAFPAWTPPLMISPSVSSREIAFMVGQLIEPVVLLMVVDNLVLFVEPKGLVLTLLSFP